jgi:hypothetical protein
MVRAKDDILIFGTNIEVINDIKSFLSKIFYMKDLGEADVILNIKLIKDENYFVTIPLCGEGLEPFRLYG